MSGQQSAAPGRGGHRPSHPGPFGHSLCWKTAAFSLKTAVPGAVSLACSWAVCPSQIKRGHPVGWCGGRRTAASSYLPSSSTPWGCISSSLFIYFFPLNIAIGGGAGIISLIQSLLPNRNIILLHDFVFLPVLSTMSSN